MTVRWGVSDDDLDDREIDRVVPTEALLDQRPNRRGRRTGERLELASPEHLARFEGWVRHFARAEAKDAPWQEDGPGYQATVRAAFTEAWRLRHLPSALQRAAIHVGWSPQHVLEELERYGLRPPPKVTIKRGKRPKA